jgi:hypothetical protein
MISREQVPLNISRMQEGIASIAELVPTLKTDTDFMPHLVKCMNYVLYLLKVTALLAPSADVANRGFTRRRAIILGHLVRTLKLYEGYLLHLTRHEGELCAILGRILIETVTRMEYLMNAKPGTFKHFVLISYRPEKEQLQDLERKQKERPLLPIEKRMLAALKSRMQRDGVTRKALLQNKQWDLDGKNLKALLEALGKSAGAYAYGFAASSHWIHGDWRDLSYFHLRRAEGFYHPKLEFDDTDPRYAGPTTILVLRGLVSYIKRSKVDPDAFLTPFAVRLLRLIEALDAAHERTLHT